MVKPSALKLSEADVALACVQFLQAHGWRVHRLTADNYAGHRHKRHERTEAGTPDYVALLPDKSGLVGAFYLEVKRPNGKLRASQKQWIDHAVSYGFEVCVADSFEEFKDWYGANWG